MPATLYHNPRCSKSRQAKALLTEAGVAFEECLYLKADLTADHFAQLLTALGGQPVDHLRRGEAPFANLPADPSIEQVAQALAQDPILLERPVFVNEKGAVMGRPPEQVLTLI